MARERKGSTAALTHVMRLPHALATELLDFEALYDVLDVDHSGLIDWREFVVLLPLLTADAPAHLHELPLATLRLFCLCFDTDGDGRLARKDVAQMLRVMHAAVPYPPGHALSVAASDIFDHIKHDYHTFVDPTGQRQVRECIDMEAFIEACVEGGLVLEAPLVPRA